MSVEFFPKFNNITENLDWLKEKQFIRQGMDLGLTRMKTACRLLSHPEKKQNTIHITGTNGKGSTVAFLSSILQNSGLRVGTFTSPHLDDWNERIKINGLPITDQDFFIVSQKIISKIKDKIQPTIFEFLALVALYYFAETKLIDLVIYEVGLGGKYDATNVILPLVCGITNIDYDHSQYLGNTLTSIAEEKSGIIKKNIPCFTTETRPQILSLFRNVAQKKQSKIYKISSPKRFTFASSESVMHFCLTTKGYTFNLKTEMLGHYQIKNISLAIHIALYLQKCFPQITQNSIEEGIEKTFWPSRMELISRNPLLFLDGAHNQAGIKHLVQTIKTFFPARQPVFLVSIMKDKQVNKILNALKEVAYQIIFTEMPGSRKQEVSKLKQYITTKFYKFADCSKAFFYFYSLLDNEKIGIITGSLHFTSYAKREFLASSVKEKEKHFPIIIH